MIIQQSSTWGSIFKERTNAGAVIRWLAAQTSRRLRSEDTSTVHFSVRPSISIDNAANTWNVREVKEVRPEPLSHCPIIQLAASILSYLLSFLVLAEYKVLDYVSGAMQFWDASKPSWEVASPLAEVWLS